MHYNTKNVQYQRFSYAYIELKVNKQQIKKNIEQHKLQAA